MKALRGKLVKAAGVFANAVKRRWSERSASRLMADLAVLALLGMLVLASAAGVASAVLPALEAFGNLQGHLAGVAMLTVLVGLLWRSRACAAVAAAVLMINLGAVGFRVLSAEACAVQMAASGQRVVKVMTLNIWGENDDFGAIVRTLAQHRPDIVFLQELRPRHAALLESLRATYPNRVVCDVHPDCGIAVLSKYRLDPRRTVDSGAVMALETGVSLEDHELVLFSTHMRRPFIGHAQSDQFQELTTEVAALPANSLVAGDFNSALWSANLSRYVKEAGLCACNVAQATWPEWLGPFGVPIDNIFLKQGVRLLSIATVSGTGSDHKALLATVGIL